MRIAWFTPFAPKSAIGDFSEAVVAALSAGDDVTIYHPDTPEHGPPRISALPCRTVPADPDGMFLESLAAYDLLVYNLGNYLAYHLPIYQTALRRPGILILHDLVMRGFFSQYFEHRRDATGYASFLARSHGRAAEDYALDLQFGRTLETLDDPERLAHPLFQPALRGALGAIVHSQYARRRIETELALPVRTVDFPAFGPSLAVAPAEKKAPAPGDQVKLLAFGVLNTNKLIRETVQAIAGNDLLRAVCRFDVVGRGTDAFEWDLNQLVAAEGLESVVHLHGWQSDERLREFLTAADIAVNLRNPHLGESSAVLVTTLLAGLPTVVWDHGYYGEFPDDVVIKISAVDQIGPALARLVGDPALRQSYRRTAKRHADEHFDTRRYCDHFRAFAGEILFHKPVLELIDRASAILEELGAIETIDHLEAKISRLIAEITPNPGP